MPTKPSTVHPSPPPPRVSGKDKTLTNYLIQASRHIIRAIQIASVALKDCDDSIRYPVAVESATYTKKDILNILKTLSINRQNIRINADLSKA